MTADPLERLEAAHEALIEALDGDDVAAIELRIDLLRGAIDAVRAQGGWRDADQLKERARRIAQLGEAARVRVNFLTDLTRQRLQILGAVRGEMACAAYGPAGRSSA